MRNLHQGIELDIETDDMEKEYQILQEELGNSDKLIAGLISEVKEQFPSSLDVLTQKYERDRLKQLKLIEIKRKSTKIVLSYKKIVEEQKLMKLQTYRYTS